MKKIKKIILPGILLMLITGVLLVTVQSSAVNNNESANGQGKLINEDGSRSLFSFNVKRNPNGRVIGQASLRNPSFKTGNGQNEQIKIDVTCLKVIGKVAILGGSTKRKNNQAKTEAIYFAVEDGGSQPDKIFRGFFFDDDASTEGDAGLCQSIEPEVLVLEPIADGKIEVKR